MSSTPASDVVSRDEPAAVAPANSIAEHAADAASSVRQRMQMLLTGSVIIAGMVVSLLGLIQWPAQQFAALALLSGLAMVIELWQVHSYESATVTPAVTLIFAAALIAGVPGVATASAALALVRYAQHRTQSRRIVFSWATHVLAGSAAVLILSSLSMEVALLPSLLLPAVMAGIVYCLIESALISAAASFESQTIFSAIWRDDLRRLSRAYLLWASLGICLAFAYQVQQLIGMIGVALPILLLRYSQKRAATQIEVRTRELQRLNQRQFRAHQELTAMQHEAQQLNGELLRLLSNTLDTRDPALDGHAARVAEYAAAVAAELGLATSRIEQVRQAALLHDLGKIALSEQVLRKRGPLTEAEYLQIQSHPALGASFLEKSPLMRQLAPFVKHHHERWDGAGYPGGLRGAQIPLEARILALSEALDTMLSAQPYRAAVPLAEVIAEIERCAGTQFDPQVVAAFRRIVAREGSRLFRSAASAPTAVPPILRSTALLADERAAHAPGDAITLS